MNEKRTYFVVSLIVFAFLIVVIRLINFQILNQEKYLSYVKKQYYSKEKIIRPRGILFDSKGKILAISVPTIKIFAIPRYVKNKEEVAENLAIILKKSKFEILRKLNSRKRYVVLADNVDKSLKPRIKKLISDLKEWNIGIVESSKRIYPYEDLIGNTLGFVNRYNGIGAEGLEYKLNKYLGGGFDEISFLKDARGNPFTIEKNKNNNTDIKNIYLTIDSNIQYMAEEALKQLIKERKPKEALVLIVNPKTGDILANATYPNYDPNRYWKYRKFKNITFQNAYEIGSLAKPFVLAEAIDENKVNFNKKIYCENGKIIIDGVRIKDHKKFKYLTPREIIVHSSNIGTIKIALELDPKKLYQKFKKLGFGKPTGVFPGEASGILREDIRPVNVAYASIGQSWTATAIQVAMAYSAIANGGYLLKPRLIKGYSENNGEIKELEEVEIKSKVLSDKSLRWLRKTLKLVVEEGTARSGKSKYFTIAGKTGTAQKYDPKLKALSNEKFYTWFAGFFPVHNPKYTIVIFANEPKKVRKWERIGGGKISSVVMVNLIDRLMFYTKQKPDKLYFTRND